MQKEVRALKPLLTEVLSYKQEVIAASLTPALHEHRFAGVARVLPSRAGRHGERA